MKAVITGANSFIGKCLLKSAIFQGWDLTLILHSKKDAQILSKYGRILVLQMEEYARLGEMTGACDCFIHLAWDGTRGAARMETERQKKNVEYSYRGVQSMLDAGCKRIITAGSQAEYGPHSDIITEETTCNPNTEYGKAKLSFYEQTARLCERYDVSYKEPRFFSLYGPEDYSGTMIMSILRQMLENKPCELTLGIQLWDFLYINDAVDGLIRLCEAVCPDGVYNFGSGDVRSLRRYVEEMAYLTGTKSEIRFGAIPYPETGMVSIWPDVSKLKRELGWLPQVSFSEGIGFILTQMQHTSQLR